MLCTNCSKKINVSSSFCSYCGYEVITETTPCAHQENKEDIAPIKLWSPNVAFILGFIFTFLFTIMIINKNWEVLGLTKKNLAVNIMHVLLILLALYSLHYTYGQLGNKITNFYDFYITFLGGNILYMVMLYFISFKSHVNYIELQIKNYTNQSFLSEIIYSCAIGLMLYLQLKTVFNGSAF